MKQPKKKKRQALQFEIARDIGLDAKVNDVGWGGLTSAEAGRIGGLLSGRNKKKRREQSTPQ